MLYYYAYSSHKYGLDRVRRGVALLKSLQRRGVETGLLVNDFRAGLAAGDLGLSGAVTIETLLDVDAVAQRGDHVILDTPEPLESRLKQYADHFASLSLVTDECALQSRFGEILLKPFCKEKEPCIETPMIDSDYVSDFGERSREREERVLFIFGDSDYGKEILSHRDFFRAMDMDLLLGYYFFVKYEEELSQIFHRLYEPEMYGDLLKERAAILTGSAQCAFEAAAAGVNTAFVCRGGESDCLKRRLEEQNIKIIDRFEQEGVKQWLEMEKSGRKNVKIIDNISKELKELLNL